MVQRKQEESWWSLVPKNESRLVSLAGELDGLDGIQPRRHLELLPYVTARSEIQRDGRRRRPVQRRPHRGRGHRPGREVGILQQHDDGRHREPRLRPGRSGPGGRQPVGVRDVLRGEAALLHRGIAGVRQFRPQRRQRLHGLQPDQSLAVLLAPDRPDAPGRGRRGVRGPAERHDHHRRREGHREDATRLDGEPHRRRHRARVRPDLDQRRGGQDRGGAVLELPGCARAARRGPARGFRDADHAGEPRALRSGPRCPTGWQRLRARRRRAPVLHGQARLRRHGQLHREPDRRVAGVSRAAAALVGALLPAARRHAHLVRPDGGIPVRLEPAERLQQEQRRHPAERVVLGRQPGLRGQRRRVHDERGPDGRPRRAGVPEAATRPVQPRPAVVPGEVEHVELRGRPDGRRVLRVVLCAVAELLVPPRERARRTVGLQRPADARRADVARARVHQWLPEHRGRRAQARGLGTRRRVPDPARRVVVRRG